MRKNQNLESTSPHITVKGETAHPYDTEVNNQSCITEKEKQSGTFPINNHMRKSRWMHLTSTDPSERKNKGSQRL